MRILTDGKIYDSTETPVLIIFDENEKDIFNGMDRFVSAPESYTVEQRQELIDMDTKNFLDGSVEFNNVNIEMRKLMDLYDNRFTKLEQERQEAKAREDDEDVMAIETLQRQCRIMRAELFHTMKRIGILDDEEVEFGAIKKLIVKENKYV